MKLKHNLFAAFKATPTVPLLALVLALGACCKDDPDPGPGPGPLPPDPPTPPVPETPVAKVPLSLHARPEGDDAPLWLDDDTLHVVLTEKDGASALGDTAFYRYVNRPEKDLLYRFAPALAKDTAFLPPDSSLVDLLVYRPASVALQREKLYLSVDAGELTLSGRPLMTAARATGLHVAAPETTVTLCHRLARLSITLEANSTGQQAPLKAAARATSPLEGTLVYLQGNPKSATWSLPEERYIAYGDTVSQPFIMQTDGTSGYLYTIPNTDRASDPGSAPELVLVVSVPERNPIRIPLDNYLPEGLLNTGTSVDIALEVNLKPDEPDNPDEPDEPDNPDNPDNPDEPDNPDNPDNPDEPDEPDNPDNPDNPDEPEPTPPVSDIIRIKVTLTDWENIIYDITLYPDRKQ